MGCGGSAMETQATCADEYDKMLKAAQEAKKGIGDVTLSATDVAGGIAQHWKLGNSAKNKSDAKSGSPSTPVIMEDGSKYLGTWKDGRKHGKGKQLFKDGTVFQGVWVAGVATGPCTLEIAGAKFDGGGSPKFEGHVRNNQAEGHGTFTYGDGSMVQGEWNGDQKNGFFWEIWSDGTKFKGHYVDGKKEGFGFQIWPDNSFYFGTFLSDRIEGWGLYQWNDGRAVRAQWSNNLMEGFGDFRWSDGRIYKGEYTNGKKEGFGEFFWTDGRQSKGYWKNSQLHGINYMTNAKGANKHALYENGTRVKFIDSASERKEWYKSEGLEEAPKMPRLPLWLDKLPAAALELEETEAIYERYDGTDHPSMHPTEDPRGNEENVELPKAKSESSKAKKDKNALSAT